MDKSMIHEPSKSMAQIAWTIFNALSDVRMALIRSESIAEADELGKCMKSFWLYSLLDSSASITVAGPQGVGKSLMVNTLLKLSPEEQLPVGEGSCEHIPVILFPAPENEPLGYAIVYGIHSGINNQNIIDKHRISLQDARNRAKHPKEEDLAIFWYVKNCPSLHMLSPLAVLPGLELDSPWEDGIRFVLDLSDVVLYTVDTARKAQASSGKIEEWIIDVGLPVPAIPVITKADMMTSAQIESMKASMGAFEPIFVGQQAEERDIQYNELWKRIVTDLQAVPPRTKSARFRRLLRSARSIILSLNKKALAEQSQSDLEEIVVIDRVIRKLEACWRSSFKPKVMERLTAILADSREGAVGKGRDHRREITDGIFKKVENWFCGGPSVDKVCNMEDEIRRYYTNNLMKRFNKEMWHDLQDGKSNDAIGEMMGVMLLKPTNTMQNDVSELIKSMREAGKVSQETADYVDVVLKGSEKVVGKIREFGASFRKDQGAELALGGTLATAGTATTAMELAGAGFAGTGATVIAATAGAAVAALAAIGIASSIVRSNRDVEWQLENYIRYYAGELEEHAKTQFDMKMERFWVLMQYEVRHHIEEKIGMNDRDRNTVSLLSSLKSAKDYLDEAETERV